MNLADYRELRLLTDISSGDSVTQRYLAKKYGLALGLTNFLMRRLVKKGHIKIVNLQRKRLRYLITPKGLAEKVRLTYEYLDYSLALYRHIRTLLTQTISSLMASGRTRTVLYGSGELAEITFVIMQQRGLSVAAIVDERDHDGRLFMNQPVRPISVLPELSFDVVMVASFTDRRKIIQQLGRWGVPQEKIVTISGEGQAHLLASEPIATPTDLPDILMETPSA